MRVEVRLLGPTEARVDGRPRELGGGRQRRLLTALAADAGAVVSADQLIDRVWAGEELPANPRAALRTSLTRLRQAIGDEAVIVTEASGWRLDVERVDLDLTRFGELVDAASDPGLDVHDRLARLDDALDLWRGDALEDAAGDEWSRSAIDRLVELRLSAIERRYEAMLAAGMHTDALPGLVGDVEQHPFRDRLVGLQMLALFRAGRQVDATRAFQAHRARLGEELGLEPGDELVDLDRRIVEADASLQLGSVAGRALRGYRLGEQLGEGAFAVVYRGTQPSVGRDVAVKIIRSELANRPEFIRRFEAEAHLVARLEHPHVVPLYDYWREPDRACLVFRYLRGGTLEADLTSRGALDLDRASQLVEQVAAGLSVAHRAGVVHRDVKPANIFLDDEDNFYLGDFGIAVEEAERSDPTAALSAGSPAYAAPEQLRRQPIGPAADIHALAITVYEALTVRLPFPDAVSHADLLQRQLNDPIPAVRELRPELPEAVDVVLARATAKDPESRYQSVDAFADDFLGAVTPNQLDGGAGGVQRRGAATALSSAIDRNPFKGLRAFTEADAADFRGRERLVNRLLELLGRTDTGGRIAAVVGPSGIGKSSVVRAGLLPALRRGALAGSDRWFVATMLPGHDPFEELGAALLRVADHVPDNMMGLLDQDHRGLARVVKALVPEDSDAAVCLVVDQFEELFTLVDDDGRRRRFLEAIEYAVTDSRCPIRVVLTMRADFWDRPLRYGAFARLIERSVVNVTALAPDELERAIVEPALATGCEFEPGLVSEIVADVADEPGALPLLQYALTELWERRISGLLTRDAYRDLGGVAGALATRAEGLHQAADEDEQRQVRRIFGRLVSLGEGTEDTRRRALRSELTVAAGADDLLDRFGRARLLSFDRDPATREPTVEVAHEALLREWPRLRSWLEDDRDQLRLLRHLGGAAADWDRTGRPESELYRGGRLEAAEQHVEANGEDLTPVERDFVDASAGLRAREDAVERERFETQVRTNRRLRGLLVGVGVLLVLALIAGGLAFQQRGRADENAAAASASATEAQASAREADANAAEATAQADRADVNAREAQVERIAAQAAAFAGDDVPLSLLLSLEAHERDPGPVGLGALQTALARAGAFLGLVAVEGASTAQWIDESNLLVAGSSGVQRVSWPTGGVTPLSDTVPYQRFHPVGDGNTRLFTMFTAAGDRYAVARADDPHVVEVRADDGRLLSTVSHDSPVDALHLTGDRELLTLDLDGWLAASDTESGDRRWRVEAHPEGDGTDVTWPAGATSVLGLERAQFTAYTRDQRPQVVDVIRDRDLVVTVEYETIRLWQLSTGELVSEQITAPVAESGRRVVTPISDFAMSDDGTRYVGAVRHLLQSGPLDGPGPGVVDEMDTTTAYYGNPKIDGVAWVTDDEVLVLLSDGRLAWTDPTTGVARRIEPTGLSTPTGFQLSPDRDRVAIVANEGLGIWSLDGDGLLARGAPRLATHHGDLLAGDVLAANYSLFPNDGWQPAVFQDVSVDPPRRLPTPTNEGGYDLGVGFGISDRYFGGQTQVTFEPSIYDAGTRKLVAVLDMPGSWTGQDFWLADGIGAFGTSNGVGIYEIETGVQTHLIEEPGPYAPSMSFNADGSVLATVGLDGRVRLYETDNWEALTPPDPRRHDRCAGGAFPPGWLLAHRRRGHGRARPSTSRRPHGGSSAGRRRPGPRGRLVLILLRRQRPLPDHQRRWLGSALGPRVRCRRRRAVPKRPRLPHRQRERLPPRHRSWGPHQDLGARLRRVAGDRLPGGWPQSDPGRMGAVHARRGALPPDLPAMAVRRLRGRIDVTGAADGIVGDTTGSVQRHVQPVGGIRTSRMTMSSPRCTRSNEILSTAVRMEKTRVPSPRSGSTDQAASASTETWWSSP